MIHHRREYRRLRLFLKQAMAFSASSPAKSENKNGHAKPPVGGFFGSQIVVHNPIVDRMREFVEKQGGSFDRQALKVAVGPARKDQIRDAIKVLVQENTLLVVRAAQGRGLGEYRRKVSGKAVEAGSDDPAST
jgi:hypothetical protein